MVLPRRKKVVRDNIINIRLSDKELERFQELATEEDLAVSTFIRRIAKKGVKTIYESEQT